VELDLERVMGESVAEGTAMTQATTQDKRTSARVSGMSWWGDKECEAAMIAVESSTIGKGKYKAVPARAKIFSKVDGLV
jgi:hypothetical protein